MKSETFVISKLVTIFFTVIIVHVNICLMLCHDGTYNCHIRVLTEIVSYVDTSLINWKVILLLCIVLNMDLHQYKMNERSFSRKDQVEKPAILFFSTIKCKLMSNKYLFVIVNAHANLFFCYFFSFFCSFFYSKFNLEKDELWFDIEQY